MQIGHPGAGISHNLLYGFAIGRFKAVNSAIGASGFIRQKWTFIDADSGVSQHILALRARNLIRSMIATAVNFYHHPNGVNFPRHASGIDASFFHLS